MRVGACEPTGSDSVAPLPTSGPLSGPLAFPPLPQPLFQTREGLAASEFVYNRFGRRQKTLLSCRQGSFPFGTAGLEHDQVFVPTSAESVQAVLGVATWEQIRP